MNWTHAIRKSLSLISRRARVRLGIAGGVQALLSILDLLGVLLVGLVGALAAALAQGMALPDWVASLDLPMVQGDVTPEGTIVALAFLAALLLLGKSVASPLLLRHVFAFLANQQANVSTRLVRQLLAQPLATVSRRPSQWTAYALIQGAGAATLTILGQGVIVISEASLLILLGAALLWVNPGVALGSIVFFLLVALLLHWSFGQWSEKSGSELSRIDIASVDAVQEALLAYREAFVSGRRGLYVHRIESLRGQAAHVAADLQFMAAFPKYVFEGALVIGGVALAGYLFANATLVAAIGTLAIFLAAATRIMPSILRLQGALLTIRNASGMAQTTFTLAEELERTPAVSAQEPQETSRQAATASLTQEELFVPTIRARSLFFTYEQGAEPTLKDISFSLSSGSSMAIIGASGVGKSTLVDVILGLVDPDQGTILVGGQRPCDVIRQHPGSIAYVPQDVAIANSTLRENVALGLPVNEIDDDLVMKAITRAHLIDVVERARFGLAEPVGERGMKLSGGQRQRLGIARALYTAPRLLVLDEATSALDLETEAALSETLRALEGDVTTVIIAHRLATVAHADLVLYLEQGRVAASGRLDDVRKAIPGVHRNALLSGVQ